MLKNKTLVRYSLDNVEIMRQISKDSENQRNEILSKLNENLDFDFIEKSNLEELINLNKEVIEDVDSLRRASIILRKITEVNENEAYSSNDRVKIFFEDIPIKINSYSKNDLFLIRVILFRNVLTIKTTYSIYEDCNLEYYVGTACCNHLRTFVPNFIYTFSSIQCSLPIYDRFGYASSWAAKETPNQLNYVIYENLEPFQTLESYLKSPEFKIENFLNYYIQILLALRVAQKIYSFTHYNLHPRNIVLRLNKEKQFYINYGENGYLLTNKIATIINYNRSHIQKNQKDYGYYFRQDLGIQPKLKHTHSDAYQLLMYSLLYMNKKSRENLKILREYFLDDIEDDDTKEALDAEFDFEYRLPKKWLSEGDLIDYINFVIERTKYNPLRKDIREGHKILDCRANKECYPYRLFVDRILSDKNCDSVSKLYSLYVRVKDNNIVKNFNPNIVINDAEMLVDICTNIIAKKLAEVEIRGILSNITDIKMLKNFQQYVSQISVLYDIILDVRRRIKAAEWYSNYIESERDLIAIEFYRKLTNDKFEIVVNHIVRIRENIDRMRDYKVKNLKKIEIEIFKNREIIFYFDQLDRFYSNTEEFKTEKRNDVKLTSRVF